MIRTFGLGQQADGDRSPELAEGTLEILALAAKTL